MTKSINKYLTLLVAAIALSCMALAGCSSAGQGASNASSSAAAEEETGMLVLGDQTDSALSIVFTNGTGAAITDLALTPAADGTAPAFLMEAGQSIGDGEQVGVFVEPAADALYDAYVVIGGVQHTLHNLDLRSLDEATIRLEGDIAYIEAMVGGNAVSSLQAEYELANPPAEEPVVEEEPAVYEEPVITYEAPAVTYEEPTTSYDSSADAAPAQTEDACVTDVVLR